MNKKIVGILICMLLFTTTTISVIGRFNEYNTPNDPFFDKQWYLDNNGQTGGTADCDIDAPEAWEIEPGDGDVVIAIIDSGIDYTHPDLINKIWTNEDEIPDNDIDDDNNGYVDDYHGYDFKNNDADMLDEHGHGTVIAGVIGAETDNNIGIAGICWNCKIMPLKFWNTDSRNEVYIDRIGNIIEAIEYAADNGANVISMSFGAVEDFFKQGEISLLNDTLNYAYNNDCVLISIAGNDNSSDPYYPGAFDNVICVAGTNHNDNRMVYQYPNHGQIVISNYGEWVDVAAPGEEIFTTSPTYDCVLTDLGREYDYTLMSGTSLAVPHVSGLAALLLSKNPTLTNDEITNIIKTNVDPYYSEYDLGTGRINAYKALKSLSNSPPEKPIINGPNKGKTGTIINYTFYSTDPDGDDIYYCVDWDDGIGEICLGLYPSNTSVNKSHMWDEKGTHIIKAKAEDINGAESDWATFEVIIPKTFISNPIKLFIMRMLTWFPLFEKILYHIT